MRFSVLLVSACSLVSSAWARDPRHVRAVAERRAANAAPAPVAASKSKPPAPPYYHHSTTTSIIPSSTATAKFKVDGTKIPDVNFDIGESYAGLLPISDERNASELYFWFFPSQNPAAKDEIVIWLNGGPGCSSLEGLLQENGPFQWQYGTFLPVKNTWGWNELSNVVWVEQPAGTGFSTAGDTPRATNEDEVAQQFLGFWKKFVDTFGLHGRKVFLTGESYAGFYVPYIADAMHNASDTKYFNIDSIQFNDPVISYDILQNDIPAVPFANYWQKLLYLNDTYMEHLNERYEACGYKSFMDEALLFPPKGLIPTPPNTHYKQPGCGLWNDVLNAASLVNPCFDYYAVATTCPLLWDVLGFPGSFPYEPKGTGVYFNRVDVKKAINAPVTTQWAECANHVLDTDTSPYSALSVLPRVIEKNQRTVIGHGILDMAVVMNGTLAAVQNMTWHGKQGFSVPPSDWQTFFVPYHNDPVQGSLGGSGSFGNWHTERGFTFVTVELSGHMIPQYAPTAAFRQLEFLLGRISNLSEVSDFTNQHGNLGNMPSLQMF